jgi:hypothetical protein
MTLNNDIESKALGTIDRSAVSFDLAIIRA